MAFPPRFVLALFLLGSLWVRGEETATFRQWIAGQEAGGSSRKLSRTPAGDLEESRDWTRLERMGTVIEQDLKETVLRKPDGSLAFTWSLTLSQEPLQGEATWSPKTPGLLKVTFKNGPPRTVELPPDATLWPGDGDDLLKTAARLRQPVRVKTYALPTQQWTLLDLVPVGPEPLPGFPDTVHFQGKASEGTLPVDVELWISPVHGEIKQLGSLGGIPLVSQRAELPAPVGSGQGAGLFERTVKTLEPHPFLLWLPEVKVRWSGKGPQTLPEDPQQRRSGDNRYTLVRAKAPTGRELTEMPVTGRPSREDAPFLAPTPLAQFHDPVFAGLDQRLRAPEGATRWELAQRVTAFVYDWIKDKNYTVGFASAQEVARTPRGDCTEHGVLAVALLRRLGVPARGVTGWVAFGESLGLHFWVEARIGGRWIPLDPTFDQAPASAYRLKLGTTDLADLGSVGWESAALTFLEGAWTPEGPWAKDVRTQGDTAIAPDGTRLRVPASRWHYQAGRLSLEWEGSHGVEAVSRPAPAQVATARLLQGSRTGRRGWWTPASGQLAVELGGGRWLQVDGLGEAQAHRLLEALEQAAPLVLKAA
jgi:transglutaminase-like putative cysteine protease